MTTETKNKTKTTTDTTTDKTTKNKTKTTTDTTTTDTTTDKTNKAPRKPKTPQEYHLAEFFDGSDADCHEKVLEALEDGRCVLVLQDRPEGVKDGAGRTPIASKVRASVKKHTADSPSPYVNRCLTVVGFTPPKTPKVIEKKIETVTEVEW